jgi:hypothetical protein
MAKRVCAKPGCPKLIEPGTRSGLCDPHEREHDRARGTRQARGYDATYDAHRRRIQTYMDAGVTYTCWRCAELNRPHPVDPKRWHLGHDNTDRSIIRGPQCPESNLSTRTSSHT